MMMQDLHNYSPSVLYIMKKDDIYATNYTKAWLSAHQTDVTSTLGTVCNVMGK